MNVEAGNYSPTASELRRTEQMLDFFNSDGNLLPEFIIKGKKEEMKAKEEAYMKDQKEKAAAEKKRAERLKKSGAFTAKVVTTDFKTKMKDKLE